MDWGDAAKIVVTAAGTVGGGAAVVAALANWLGKLWADKIIANEQAKLRLDVDAKLQRFQDEIDRGQFVHKLQFETEFKAYLELWNNVVEVRRAALNLRPIIDYMQPGKTREEINKERLAILGKAYDTYTMHYASYQPFFATPVYELARSFRNAIHEEGVDFDDGQVEIDRDYWTRARENAEKISKSADALCDAIRSRIWPSQGTTEIAKS